MANLLIKRILRRIFRLKRQINQRTQFIVGSFQGNLIKAYWYNEAVNFGDLLTPFLLRDYGLYPVYTEVRDAEILSVGSILERLPEDFPGYILGTGLMYYSSTRRFSRAKILAVRGELTRVRIGASVSTVLGDPGLLAERFLKNRQLKRHLIGFVPHYVDKSNDKIINIFRKYKNNVLLIDVQRKPGHVISEIDKCDFILSSSLHGLVVADSLGIPNAWMLLSEGVQGSGFKFYDYASAFGMNYEPQFLSGYENLNDLIHMTHEVSKGIQDVKKGLDSMFTKLSHEILENKRNYEKAKIL